MKALVIEYEVSRGQVDYISEEEIEITPDTEFRDVLAQTDNSVVNLDFLCIDWCLAVGDVCNICLDEEQYVALVIGDEKIARWNESDGKDWFWNECLQDWFEVYYNQRIYSYISKRAKQIDAQTSRIV